MNALEDFLVSEDNLNLMSVIEVEVSEETARDRVLGRARGADDNTEVFNNRMKVYLEPLADIKNFYTKKNILKVISGEGSIEGIVKEMELYIKSMV